MKYDDKTIFFFLIKSGHNIEVDSQFDDETNMLVFNGSLQVNNSKRSIWRRKKNHHLDSTRDVSASKNMKKNGNGIL